VAAAASAPRLTWGMVASVALHVAAIAAFVFAHPTEGPTPPVYRVQLIAAPYKESVLLRVAARLEAEGVCTAPIANLRATAQS